MIPHKLKEKQKKMSEHDEPAPKLQKLDPELLERLKAKAAALAPPAATSPVGGDTRGWSGTGIFLRRKPCKNKEGKVIERKFKTYLAFPRPMGDDVDPDGFDVQLFNRPESSKAGSSPMDTLGERKTFKMHWDTVYMVIEGPLSNLKVPGFDEGLQKGDTCNVVGLKYTLTKDKANGAVYFNPQAASILGNKRLSLLDVASARPLIGFGRAVDKVDDKTAEAAQYDVEVQEICGKPGIWVSDEPKEGAPKYFIREGDAVCAFVVDAAPDLPALIELGAPFAVATKFKTLISDAKAFFTHKTPDGQDARALKDKPDAQGNLRFDVTEFNGEDLVQHVVWANLYAESCMLVPKLADWEVYGSVFLLGMRGVLLGTGIIKQEDSYKLGQARLVWDVAGTVRRVGVRCTWAHVEEALKVAPGTTRLVGQALEGVHTVASEVVTHSHIQSSAQTGVNLAFVTGEARRLRDAVAAGTVEVWAVAPILDGVTLQEIQECGGDIDEYLDINKRIGWYAARRDPTNGKVLTRAPFQVFALGPNVMDLVDK